MCLNSKVSPPNHIPPQTIEADAIKSTDYLYHRQETDRRPPYGKQKSGNPSNKPTTKCEKEETQQHGSAEKKKRDAEE
jgi:hypothetical protein